MSDTDRSMVRLGGLWERRSRAGDPYLGGVLGGGELLVFRNRQKSSDRDPDFVVYLAARREREPARTSGSPAWSTRSPRPADPPPDASQSPF
jgi:hypothetical protein